MNFHRRKREKIDISMTPMVDAMLVLLIFFMITTTFDRSVQLEVKLPESGGVEAPQETKRIDLIINAGGEYALVGEDGLAHELVSQSVTGLQNALVKLSGDTRNLPFVINADAKTPHQAVISALDVASRLGFSKITFATRKADADEN